MKKRTAFILGIMLVIATIAVFSAHLRIPVAKAPAPVTAPEIPATSEPRAEAPSVPPVQLPLPAGTKARIRSASQAVPFLSQAPTGKWGDPLYQNGCEEASVLMAEYWASGKPFPGSADEATLIRDTAKKIEAMYGTSHDTSAKDLAAFIGAQGSPLSVEFRSDVMLDDVRSAFMAGYAIIVPMDGRKLGNPHYAEPGPERHMVVAVGYDADTGEIVTNDPGTKFGAGYRYPEARFYAAIRDYETGDGTPIPSVRKDIIVIGKK